jgi:S-adenosylmethionine hydrolase
VPLAFPAPAARDGGLDSTVLFVDSFGNFRLAGVPADLEAAVGPLVPGRPFILEFAAHDGRPATSEAMPWCRTFGERPVGAPLLYENSFGQLAIADNQGNAAARLGIVPDRPVRIRPT